MVEKAGRFKDIILRTSFPLVDRIQAASAFWCNVALPDILYGEDAVPVHHRWTGVDTEQIRETPPEPSTIFCKPYSKHQARLETTQIKDRTIKVGLL